MSNLLRKLMAGIVLVSTLTSCGNEPQKPAEEKKADQADLFSTEPAFDDKAVNPDAPVSELTVTASGNTMAEMKYDVKELKVKAGTTVKLKFINNSTDAAMPHNWVLVYEGTMETVATEGISAGKAGNFVPKSPDVLTSSRLLGPGESEELTFPAPPAGKYQFVCTYPGHWSIMNGTFIVE